MPVLAPILGSMRFGTWGANLTPMQVAELLQAALDLGMDSVDIADIYGDHRTNALLGEALHQQPTLKKRLRWVAKIGIVLPQSPGNARGVQHYNLSPEHLQRALDTTLRDLGVEHLHQLLLHRPDALLDAPGVADWVRAQQAAGRIGAFGVSNFSAAQLAPFDALLPMAAHQLELSLAQSAALEDGRHAASRVRGAEVQAWSPLGGGGLIHDPRWDALGAEFGLSRSAFLLRWVASLPSTRVVLGTARAERLPEAMHACAEPLPRDAWYAAWQIARGGAVP
jgi:predicted oxidoreductase